MKPHAIDPVSLVSGLVFVLGAGFWLGWRDDVVSVGALAWVAPGALITLGLLLLTVSTVHRR